MKKTLLTLLISSICMIANAQITDNESKLRDKKSTTDTIEGWKFGGMTDIKFSNTKLYNWAAGGDNTIAINGILNMGANYKKGKSIWDNSLNLGYGIMRQGSTDLENGEKRPFKKTDDKIELSSKYGYMAFKKWYYAALLDFKTQMTEGRNYTTDTAYTVVSKALAPAYLTGGMGLDYKPNNYFSAYISPITARFIIVNDQTLADLGSFGVTPAKYVIDEVSGTTTKIKNGELCKYELGGYARIQYSRTQWNAKFMKGVGLTTKLNIFSNYIENPENIDIDWSTLITFKINDYINVSFDTQLLYDDDTKNPVDENNDGTIDRIEGPKIQFKEILGVGFSYKF